MFSFLETTFAKKEIKSDLQIQNSAVCSISIHEDNLDNENVCSYNRMERNNMQLVRAIHTQIARPDYREQASCFLFCIPF